MDFMTAAKTGFNKLTDFDGKAGRAEYWWYVLAAFIASILINVVIGALGLGLIGALIGQLIGIGLLIAATVRRLNDVGRPAMFAYVYFGLGIVFSIMPLIGMMALSGIVGIVLLVLLIVMIYFLVQPSKA